MERITKLTLHLLLILALTLSTAPNVFAAETSPQAVYDLQKGGTQTFFVEDENGEMNKIVIEKIENKTRIADDTYHVSYQSSGWTAGFYLKILSNKIMSISSPYHTVSIGKISNTFFHLNSHQKATYSFDYTVAIIKYQTGLTASIVDTQLVVKKI